MIRSSKFEPGTTYLSLLNKPQRKDATGTSEMISSDELKAKLCHKLKNDGVLDKLKALIRQNLVCELKPHRESFQSSNSNGSLPLQVINWLFEEHLKRNGFDFTLSVFTVESGNSELLRQKMLSILDVLKCLDIDAASELGQQVLYDYADKSSRLFLWNILNANSAKKSSKCMGNLGYLSNKEHSDDGLTNCQKSEDKNAKILHVSSLTDAHNNVFLSKEREQQQPIVPENEPKNVGHLVEMLNLLQKHVSKFDSAIFKDEGRQQLLDTKEEDLRKEKQELDNFRLHLNEEELRLNQLKFAILQILDSNTLSRNSVATQTPQCGEDNVSQEISSEDLKFSRYAKKFDYEIATLKEEFEAAVKAVQNCGTLQSSVEKLTLAVQDSFIPNKAQNIIKPEETTTSNSQRLEYELESLRRNYKHDLALWEQQRELMEHALVESRKIQTLSTERQSEFVSVGRELIDAVKNLQNSIEVLQTSARSESRTAQKNAADGHETYFDTSLSASHLPPELQLGINSSVGTGRVMSELNETRYRIQSLCSKSERMEKTYKGFLSSYPGVDQVSSVSRQINLISPELKTRWREYVHHEDSRSNLRLRETPGPVISSRAPTFSTPIWEKLNVSRNLAREFDESSFLSSAVLKSSDDYMEKRKRVELDEKVAIPNRNIPTANENELLTKSVEIGKTCGINNNHDTSDASGIKEKDGDEKSAISVLESSTKIADNVEGNAEVILGGDETAFPIINLDSLWKSGNIEML